MDKIRQIVEKFGADKQLIVALEELGELQKPICKALRGQKPDIENITEEIADVTLMLEQLKIIFNISPVKVNEIINHKIDRTLGIKQEFPEYKGYRLCQSFYQILGAKDGKVIVIDVLPTDEMLTDDQIIEIAKSKLDIKE